MTQEATPQIPVAIKKKGTRSKKTVTAAPPATAETVPAPVEPLGTAEATAEPTTEATAEPTTEETAEPTTEETVESPENVVSKKVNLEELDKLIDSTLKLKIDQRDEGKKVIDQLRKIKKDFKVVLREVQKYRNRRNQRAGGNVNRKRSGFYDPRTLPLSTQLCDFLGVDHGTQLSHDAVGEQIRGYIKENNLQDPENRRNILPDAKMERLFGNEAARRHTMELRLKEKPEMKSKPNGELTYFNLQTFLRPHFLKAGIPLVESSSVASSSSA